MEIRRAWRVAKRPVRQTTLSCFDDGGQGQAPRRVRWQPVEMRDHFQFEAIRTDPWSHARWRIRGGGAHPRAVTRKPIKRPGGRGGEIQFVITSVAIHRQECLAAGVTPEPVSAARFVRSGKAQVGQVAFDPVIQYKSCLLPAGARRHAPWGWMGRGGVRNQGDERHVLVSKMS